jgi:hypothetical protein
MKKISVLLVAFLLVSIFSFGATSAQDQLDYAALSVNELAYCDLSAVPDQWKDDVLSARREIIFSMDWTVEGQCEYIKADGTVIVLPEYTELFPDWDIPTVSDFNVLNEAMPDDGLTELKSEHGTVYSTGWTVDGQCEYTMADGTIVRLPEFSDLYPDMDMPTVSYMNEFGYDGGYVDSTSAALAANYVGFVYLFTATTQTPPPFYAFFSYASRVIGEASTLPGASFNLGYSNLSTNQMLGYQTYMIVGDKLSLRPNPSLNYAAHASTFSTEGYALLRVYDE